MAAERFAKCYPFPKGLGFVSLVEEIDFDWGHPNPPKGKGRENKKGKRGKGRK